MHVFYYFIPVNEVLSSELSDSITPLNLPVQNFSSTEVESADLEQMHRPQSSVSDTVEDQIDILSRETASEVSSAKL